VQQLGGQEDKTDREKYHALHQGDEVLVTRRKLLDACLFVTYQKNYAKFSTFIALQEDQEISGLFICITYYVNVMRLSIQNERIFY